MNNLMEGSELGIVWIYVEQTVDAILKQPTVEQFIINTIYEIFNVLIYLFLPINLLLWTGFTIQVLKVKQKQTATEKIEVLLIPTLIIVGTLEVIIRFVVSGSLESIKSYLDYEAWALIFIGWMFLAIIHETFQQIIQDVSIGIPSINKSLLNVASVIVLTIIWISIRVVLGVNQSLLFLVLINILSLLLIVSTTLPKEMTPRILVRWLFIINILFLILVVYPGIMVDPPKIETQSYIYLRNQITILGVVGIIWLLLFNVLERNEHHSNNF